MMAVIEGRADLPETWSATSGVAWKTRVPGLGWSSPIVSGNRIFVTAVTVDTDGEMPKKGLYLPATGADVRPEPPSGQHHWKVYCLDATTGAILWERTAHQGAAKSSRHPKNSYASETATTDGERVYVLFGNLGVFAYDFDGNLAWARLVDQRVDKWGWGTGSSPILLDDQLIVVHDNVEESYIMALDAKTGRQNWRIVRDEVSAWSTPFVWKNEKRTEIVTVGQEKVRSYDASGKLLWYLSGRMTQVTVPSPFAAHGLLYASSGYVADEHRPVYAIRPGASGDITLKPEEESSDYVAWYQPRIGAYNPSAIVYGDYYYTLLDGGFITCHNARTGEEVYGRQRIETGATFTASPWAYNGKVFALSEDGNTYVIQAGPQYKLLGKNVLDEMTLASPALANGRVLIRTAAHVYSIKK
jgi:outer membrane protein assembly factor BamB